MICTTETLDAAHKAERSGRSTWRISSTVFSQLASDEVLEPLPLFRSERSALEYPAMPVGAFVESELQYINLMAS